MLLCKKLFSEVGVLLISLFRIRAAFSLLSIIFFCMHIVSCGKQTTNVEYGNQHKILFIANGDDPASLDPQLATGLSERNIFFALFEGLTGTHPANMEIVPGVAERWEVSRDRLTYRFYLRENARWSNGDALTAADFVYSWRRMLEPSTAGSFAYLLYAIKNAEAFNKGVLTDFNKVGVKAIGERELEVTLAQPTPYFLQLLDHFAFYPVHPPTIAKFSDGNPMLSKWTLPANMVSNGAFHLDEWRIASHVKVIKNPHYWDSDVVQLEGIVFSSISDKATEERAFRSGQVHLTNTPRMAIEKIAAYRKDYPEYLVSTPMYASIHYAFNTRRAPFDDTRVRRALALAIDRSALVENILKAGEQPGHSFVPPNPNGYQPQPLVHYDPETARQLLAEAGYENGVNFPSVELLMVNEQVNFKVAVAIQQMWKKELNIEVGLRQQEWKAFIQSRKAGDFAISSGSWYADYIDPGNFFDVLRPDSGNNHTGWQNNDYGQLCDAEKLAADSRIRFGIFDQANLILANDMPVIPLFYPINVNTIHTSVINWHQNLGATMNYKFVRLEEKKEDKK